MSQTNLHDLELLKYYAEKKNNPEPESIPVMRKRTIGISKSKLMAKNMQNPGP